MQAIENISSLVQEYQSIIENSPNLDRESLENQLAEEADWTDRGAEELVCARYRRKFSQRPNRRTVPRHKTSAVPASTERDGLRS